MAGDGEYFTVRPLDLDLHDRGTLKSRGNLGSDELTNLRLADSTASKAGKQSGDLVSYGILIDRRANRRLRLSRNPCDTGSDTSLNGWRVADGIDSGLDLLRTVVL